MEASAAAAIRKTYEKSRTWHTSSIMIDVCVSLNSPETVEYDFGGTIGQYRSSGRKIHPTDTPHVRLYLPPQYNQNESAFRKNTLAPLLSCACAREGFSVIVRGWEARLQCLRFRCQRGRKHQEATSRGKVRQYFFDTGIIFCLRYFVTGIIFIFDTGIIFVKFYRYHFHV
jgi:hypothetical protein